MYGIKVRKYHLNIRAVYISYGNKLLSYNYLNFFAKYSIVKRKLTLKSYLTISNFRSNPNENTKY